MDQYLIDTNVVSDYFSASFSVAGMVFMDKVIDAVPNISIITQIELLCWNADEIIMQNVQYFIKDCVILDITHNVITHCIQLRKGKKIKIPDAIIAATAIAHGYSIITNNEKDFDKITGLKIVNPHKM